jgi:hypothetical protein
LQGTPYGPAGINLFSPGGKTAIIVPNSDQISVTTSTYGTNYLIGTTGLTGPVDLGNAILLQGYVITLTLPSTMVAGDAGAYWVFTSTSGYPLQMNLVNGTAVYRGTAAATTFYVGSSMALAYSGTGTSYIVL